MEWVVSVGEGRNTSMLLQEFERRFTRLSALDQTVLDTSKVLLFINSVDPLYREKVGLFLEIDDGLTIDWAVVKRVCSRFDKRREWNDAGPLATGGIDSEMVERNMKVAQVWCGSDRRGQGPIQGRNSGRANEDGARSLDRQARRDGEG